MSYAETGLINILVIDDEEEMRTFLTSLLLPLGYQVITVESAEAGLEQLPYQTFDIAFLDHQLPGMDGLVFGEYLLKNNPFMKIALVTGNTAPRVERESIEHDIAFIRKPFKVEEILDVVEEYKQISHARQEASETSSQPCFAPVIRDYFKGLPTAFNFPDVPGRIQKLLFQQIRSALAEMRIAGYLSEESRVKAFSGLLAAQVLGIKLPKLKDGSTPWEAYDKLMESYKGRLEFTPPES